MLNRFLNTSMHDLLKIHGLQLREKCSYSVFFCPYFPVFGLNTDQKNSGYGHFSRSVCNALFRVKIEARMGNY